MMFGSKVLSVDSASMVDTISSFIRDQVTSMRRDGSVIGLSGGVDSALCAHLCVRALGRDRVLGLILPERESEPVSAEYAQSEARLLGIRTETVDITPTIEAAGAYDLRDSAIREFFPDYGPEQRSKIVLPGGLLSRDSFNFYTLVVEGAEGKSRSARLNNRALRQIVAATNLKQRTRMLYLYSFAERCNYLVCGTTNRTEYIQGFFVRYGDGGVDIEPVCDLYKTQVYELATHLGVSKDILDRPPTPDTFSLGVTDEEFYFRVPYDKLDLLIYAWENEVSIDNVCDGLGLSRQQVERVFRDLTSKYNATRHLRVLPPTPGLKIGKDI